MQLLLSTVATVLLQLLSAEREFPSLFPLCCSPLTDLLTFFNFLANQQQVSDLFLSKCCILLGKDAIAQNKSDTRMSEDLQCTAVSQRSACIRQRSSSFTSDRHRQFGPLATTQPQKQRKGETLLTNSWFKSSS